MHRHRFDAANLSELGDGHANPHVFYPAIPSLIQGLLFRSGPSAVLRFVVAVVVDTIYGMFAGGFRPHIGIKRREIIQPALADRNASPSVEMEFRIARIEASALHLSPSGIFWRALRLAMRSVHRSYLVAHQASTTLSITARQIVDADFQFLSARTSAEPAILALSALDDQQATVGFSGYFQACDCGHI
jgi:hypothetical protein